MAETVDAIATQVRFVADDMEIQFLDTGVLMTAINAGYREFQRRMALAGSGLMKNTAILTVPANTTTIPNTNGALGVSDPPLPDDFVLPYILWERPTSSPAVIFQQMQEVDWPLAVPPKSLLGVWAWQGGALNFTGATQILDVQMEYGKKYPVLIAPNQELPAPFWGAIDAITWCVLYMVAMQRGASEAFRKECTDRAEQFVSELTQLQVHRDQIQRRHRPGHNRWLF